jgi:hypothetical protein
LVILQQKSVRANLTPAKQSNSRTVRPFARHSHPKISYQKTKNDVCVMVALKLSLNEAALFHLLSQQQERL